MNKLTAKEIVLEKERERQCIQNEITKIRTDQEMPWTEKEAQIKVLIEKMKDIAKEKIAIREWDMYHSMCTVTASGLNSGNYMPNSVQSLYKYYIYELTTDYFALLDCPDPRLPSEIPALNVNIDLTLYASCKQTIEDFHKYSSDGNNSKELVDESMAKLTQMVEDYRRRTA